MSDLQLIEIQKDKEREKTRVSATPHILVEVGPNAARSKL